MLGFAGQLTEPGADLQHLRARWYDPGSGQFLTRDPLERDTHQPYLYAAGNPAQYTDPTGQSIWNDIASFGGSAIHAASLGTINPGWVDPCSWGSLGGEQIGGAFDPFKKAKAAGELAGVVGITARGERAAARGGTTVLGHYPEYIELSEKVGSRPFNVPTRVWDGMSPAEQWTANQKFLDRAIARGNAIRLATPPNAVREGSFFEHELQYLTSKGYRVSDDGTHMVRGG